MFDLNNMKFIKDDEERGRRNYSFVGIQRSKSNDEQLEFWLPLGFRDFDHSNFEEVKRFFFRMYKTFKIYLKKKEAVLKDDDITINRDGIIEKEEGFSFKNEKKDQPIFYGKLNAIDKILEGYDELRISALEKKQIRSHEVDFTKLHRYMHQAVYLEEDVIYLDAMNIAKNVIVKSSPPILQLFCFIFSEIKSELNEADSVPARAFELSDQFKEEYLQPDSTLFQKNSFSETLELLRGILNDIDIYTTYKDEDYWHFFEATEAFLYGERSENDKDIYWGFSSFYDVWEDMCQSYMLTHEEYRERLVYADLNGKLTAFFPYQETTNPFDLILNGLLGIRQLRPDLVLEPLERKPENIFSAKKIIKNRRIAFGIKIFQFQKLKTLYPEIFSAYWKYVEQEENFIKRGSKYFYMYEQDYNDFVKTVERVLDKKMDESPYKIIDYKYMRLSDYQNYSPSYLDSNRENKVKEDIHKQLIYEWAVQKNWSVKTQSEFWIPFFTSDDTIFKEEEEITNAYFKESQIKLIKINFDTLQNHYLEQITL